MDSEKVCLQVMNTKLGNSIPLKGFTTNPFFACTCTICKSQITHGHTFKATSKSKIKITRNPQDLATASKLMELLGSTSSDIEGCEVLVTDSLFFEDGKPSLVIRTDLKTGRVVIQTNKPKLPSKLSTIVSSD
jgi:hypothetical protein